MSNRTTFALVFVALAYSIGHFAFSGVRQPLAVPNIGQVYEEYEVLRKHLATGRPIHIEQPRQYGPTFILAMHGVVLVCGDDQSCLVRTLYAIQLGALVGAFVFNWLSLRLWLMRMGRGPTDGPSHVLLFAALFILWTNFAPALAIVATKNVEMWELCLVSIALFAYLRDRRLLSAACVVVASLMKLLPFAWLFYFLLVDRRAFAYGVASALMVLSISQALYGFEMGYGYLYIVGAGAVAPSAYGNAPGLAWHENISVKGIVGKMFGHLENPAFVVRPGTNQVGYLTVATPVVRLVGNIVSYTVQAAGLAWMVWLLLSRRPSEWHRETQVMWDWALISVMLLILSPQTGIDYQTLALPAFTVVLGVCVAFPEWLRDPWISMPFAGAVWLVANVAPRSIVVRLSGASYLLRWSGYDHLTSLEAYSYYGYPLVGLILLTVSLMAIRSKFSEWTIRGDWRITA